MRSIRQNNGRKIKKKNKADLQIRRDLFAQLLSKKKRLTQLYFSSFETKIYSNYHTCSEAIFEAQENEGKVVDSYLKEQRYWKRYWIRRGHHLQDILFAEEDEFLKLIGLVSVVFPETEGLKKLISKIDNIKTLIPPPEPILSDFKTDPISALNRLEKWKNDTTISLDAKVKKEYLQPIDDLIDFLKPYLKNDLGQDQPRRQD